MKAYSDRYTTAALVVALATVFAAALILGGTASAFDGEPNGWGKHKWGSSLASVVKTTPEFRKKYNVNKLQQAMEGSDVILANETDFLGKPFGTQWFFGEKGLNRVVLTWEDGRPNAYNAYKVLMEELETKWGPHSSEGSDGEWIWEGNITRVQAKRLLVASGSGIEITMVAKEFGADAPAPGTNTDTKAKGKEKGIVKDADKSFLDDL